jgi:hypothetical protein
MGNNKEEDVLYKNNNEEIFKKKFENNGNSLWTTDIKIVLKDKNMNI